MGLILVSAILSVVIWLYFHNNPLNHSRRFMWRRFINWFPLGMTYAFLYMARYNLNVSKNAFGDLMTKEDFGIIFGAGTITYGLSFLLNGPLVDKIGGKKGIIIAALGSCIMNGALGLVTYLFLHNQFTANLTLTFAIIYSLNMFFQSYGAVSIIKVKAYWFHVRERGVFGAIFGTLISFGVYFAFDWGQAIVDAAKKDPTTAVTPFQNFIKTIFAIENQPVDSLWLVFFIPSILLVFWALIDMILLKDEPSQAGFDEFDPHDASSDESEDQPFSITGLLKRMFTSPIMLTIAFIEFTSGVIRNGVIQWYFIFAKEIPQIGAEFVFENWGLLLCLFGIVGGFSGGLMSDKLFHSRRGPPAMILMLTIFTSVVFMGFYLFSSPWIVAGSALIISFAVIGVHSLMSGTAAADFGGRKATATASGIVDGFVYLGSGLQSISLGFLTSKSWMFWPVFLAPFALIGAFFAYKIWHDLPEATRRYLLQVEKVTLEVTPRGSLITRIRKFRVIRKKI